MQIDILKQEFLRNPKWTRRQMREMSTRLGGISVTKIYKWNWDRHKRVHQGLPLTRNEDGPLMNANQLRAKIE